MPENPNTLTERETIWLVIQNVCRKLSFAFNDSEKKLETMTEALNEAYQQQHDRINQLQIVFLFAH